MTMERHFVRDEDSNGEVSLVSASRARQTRREELLTVSRELANEITEQVPRPTGAQWKAFSMQLEEQVDRESSRFAGLRFISSLRDSYSATDSKAYRLLIILILAMAVIILTLLFWALGAVAWRQAQPLFVYENVSGKAVAIHVVVKAADTREYSC